MGAIYGVTHKLDSDIVDDWEDTEDKRRNSGSYTPQVCQNTSTKRKSSLHKVNPWSKSTECPASSFKTKRVSQTNRFYSSEHDFSVYTWALVKATEEDASGFAFFAYILLSILFSLGILAVGMTFFYGAIVTSCADNHSCGTSDACMPTMGNIFPLSLSPGRCFPCDYCFRYRYLLKGGDDVSKNVPVTSGLFFLFWRHTTEIVKSAGDISCPFCDGAKTWIDMCQEHCDEWVKFRKSSWCSRMVENASYLSPYAIFLTILVLGIWAASAVDELEDAKMNFDILRKYSMKLPSFRRKLVLHLGRVKFFYRVFLISNVALGAWGLVIRSNFYGPNILLDVFGITFVMQIDDVLPRLFLKLDERLRIVTIIAGARAEFRSTPFQYGIIRIFCSYFVLAVAITSFFPFHSHIIASGSFVEPRYRSCIYLSASVVFVYYYSPFFVFFSGFYCFWLRESSLGYENWLWVFFFILSALPFFLYGVFLNGLLI